MPSEIPTTDLSCPWAPGSTTPYHDPCLACREPMPIDGATSPIGCKMLQTSQTTTVWVLAYILRFPNEPGEWAQVSGRGYATELQARAVKNEMSKPDLYQVCKVEMQNV